MTVWQYTRSLQTGAYYFAETDWEECPAGESCDRWLERLGWEPQGAIPNHQDHEFGTIDFLVYRHNDQRQFLIDAVFRDSTIATIRCASPIDFLLLLRDFLNPLARGADADLLADAVTDAGKYLFDPEFGLDCAREVRRRERAQERQRLQERQKNSKPGS